MTDTVPAPVLVIEDDPDVRQLLCTRLIRLGHRVVLAGDGEAGLRAAAAERPRLVILDILLPDIDGWEVLRRLRADAALETVPVLVTSIVELDRDLDRLDLVGFLAKPFRSRQVDAMVGSVLAPG